MVFSERGYGRAFVDCPLFSLRDLFAMQVASPHPPQSPFHFFPKPSSSSQIPSVSVKTRVVEVPPQLTRPAATPLLNVHHWSQPRALSRNPLAKRSSSQQHNGRRSKRARLSEHSDATPPPSPSFSRESSIVSSISSSSRASTRNRSSPPTSLPPSTRSSSRSSSVLPTTDEPIPRECHIHHDAVLDDSFLSSEKVVLRLMKSYVRCWSLSLFPPLFASSHAACSPLFF